MTSPNQGVPANIPSSSYAVRPETVNPKYQTIKPEIITANPQPEPAPVVPQTNPNAQPAGSANIYANIPDQFTKYEQNPQNAFDYFTSSGEFNLALFNKTFREEQLKRIAFYKDLEEKRLKELNTEFKPMPDLHKMTVGQHLLNMKDTFFAIWQDLQTEPLNSSIILRDHRLFYIGLLLVIIFIIYVIFKHLVSTSKTSD
jgi:hypothetical protein